jgi:hypothetical protein
MRDAEKIALRPSVRISGGLSGKALIRKTTRYD